MFKVLVGIFFKGFVALVVGGDVGPSVVVYSPEGRCQHRLPDIPIGGTQLHYLVLAFIDEKIFVCAGNSDGNGTVTNLCIFIILLNIKCLVDAKSNKQEL
jgi:hypothetical protein